MSYVGSVYLIQLFVNFISHLSTEAESRAHITHSSSLLLLQHTQYILHMPQHWWNSSQHYTANTTQYKSYFLNAKNLWDASERGNIPTQPQHLGLKHKVMAQVWQEWGVSAGLGTPNTLQQCRRIFYKIKRAEDSAWEALWFLRVWGCTIFNCITQRFVPTKHPTGLSYPCPLFPTSHFTQCIYFYLWNIPPCPPWQGLAWLHPAQVLLSQLQSKQNCCEPFIKRLRGKPRLEQP